MPTQPIHRNGVKCSTRRRRRPANFKAVAASWKPTMGSTCAPVAQLLRRHPPSKWRHPLNPVRGTQTPRCVMRPTIAETIDRNQEKRRQRREAAGNSTTSPPPIQLQLTTPPRMSFQRHQSTRSSGPNDQRRVQSPPAFHQHFNSAVLSVATVTPLSATATDRPRCNTHPHPNHPLLLTCAYLQRRQPRRTQSTKTQPSITTHPPLVTAGPN